MSLPDNLVIDSSMSFSHSRNLSLNTLLESNQRLEKALEFEEFESSKLEKLVQDYKNKLSSSLSLQSQLENDLVDRNNEIISLKKQLKESRISKNEAENSLSQEVMNYINEKQQWLDKENDYEEKVEELKFTNKALADKVDILTLDLESIKSTPIAAPPPISPTTPIPTNTKVIDRLKKESEMIHQQMEMVSREYSTRFNKLKEEMEQIKSLNNRLIEENEGFQLLLAEKTILGGFSLADELDGSGNSESDSELSVNDIEVKGDIVNDNVNDGQVEEIEFKQDETADISNQDIEDTEDTQDTQDPLNNNDNNQTTITSSITSTTIISTSINSSSKLLYELKFENNSLKNHNKALKLSLERLVHRLLEYREFEKIVEDHNIVTKRSISSFNDRVNSSSSSSSSTLNPPKQRATSTSIPYRGHSLTASISSSINNAIGRKSRPSHSHTSSNPLFHMNPPTTPSGVVPRQYRGALKPSSTWSTMLFSKQNEPIPRSPSSTSSLTSSSASISSGSSISIDHSRLTEEKSIRSIKSQKELRPLKLLVPSNDNSISPLPSASSQNSGWFS